MSRLRKDPIVGRWIIISTDRPKNPEEYSFEEPVDDVTPAECPFCRGNEAKTPKEIASFRAEKIGAECQWLVGARDPEQVPRAADRRHP